MRMFLIVMCDIFLILYLTGLTKVQSPGLLTINDFYQLKAMKDDVEADKEKMQAALQEKLRQQKVEKERLLAQQKEQEELAAQLAAEKAKLASQLSREQQKTAEVKESLVLSNAEREKINQDLQEKERMLRARENLLANLNKEIAAKEKARRKMEAAYQQDIKEQQQEVEKNRLLAQQRQVEAHQAEQLADQMKQEAAQATKTAEVAVNVQKKALALKEQALKEKKEAEKRAAEALQARQQAEAEKERAIEAMQVATKSKKKAEKKAQQLATTIQDIKQDGETAYAKNILPQVQALWVSYARDIADQTVRYERELTLLPVKIDGKTVVIFPSRQIGFTARSDKAPDELALMYQGKKIAQAWIDKNDDLVALVLPGYQGPARAPYPVKTAVDALMPVLLSIRNKGDVGLIDKLRGISGDYFIVNRDYLESAEDNSLSYTVKGFRGTGTRGERIVRGDQLIDLNGQLIGIANDPDHVLRINSLKGWEKIEF